MQKDKNKVKHQSQTILNYYILNQLNDQVLTNDDFSVYVSLLSYPFIYDPGHGDSAPRIALLHSFCCCKEQAIKLKFISFMFYCSGLELLKQLNEIKKRIYFLADKTPYRSDDITEQDRSEIQSFTIVKVKTDKKLSSSNQTKKQKQFRLTLKSNSNFQA